MSKTTCSNESLPLSVKLYLKLKKLNLGDILKVKPTLRNMRILRVYMSKGYISKKGEEFVVTKQADPLFKYQKIYEYLSEHPNATIKEVREAVKCGDYITREYFRKTCKMSVFKDKALTHIELFEYLKKLKKGDVFYPPHTRKHDIYIGKLIKKGYVVRSSCGKCIIQKEIVAETLLEKIHEYVLSHDNFSIQDIVSSVGCSTKSASYTINRISKIHNLEKRYVKASSMNGAD